MKGWLVLVVCYGIGEVVSWVTRGFLPAGVGGMILLFVLLRAGAVKAMEVKGVCRFLLDNMMLFFVPVSVGLMTVTGFGTEDILPLMLVVFVPVVVVLGVSGLVMEKMRDRKGEGS